MGLMPVYYTTTKLSGKRKSSVRTQRLNADHEKWLRSMGIDKSFRPKSEPLKFRAKKIRSVIRVWGVVSVMVLLRRLLR